ncbi:Tryptase, partial [Stegodyphus mimosarum]
MLPPIWFLFVFHQTVAELQINSLADSDTRPRCECGANRSSIKARVVGGHNAGKGIFPYAIGLLDAEREDEQSRIMRSQPFCGATLVSDRHVLTAAHCVKERTADHIAVDIGDYNLQEVREDNHHIVRNITKYPDYIPGKFHSDIAVIEFERPVDWSSGVRAAWLPSSSLELEPGTTVSVYGWGRLKYGGSHPDILQTVELPVVNSTECQTEFVTVIEPSMLCAGGESGKDACIGDSGSGLVVRLDNEYVLCGLVSFGRRCALPHVPGVYTRVSSFIDWIYNQTLSSDCKPCIYTEEEESFRNIFKI